MKAKILLEIEAPCDCSKEQFLSWIHFNMGFIYFRKADELTSKDFPLDRWSGIKELNPSIIIE